MGSIHPKVRHHFDIKEGVFHASLLWETITALKIKSGSKPFESLPKYPSIRRDLALLVDSSINYAELTESIVQTERKLLRDVFLFDVYEGDKLPKGKKSYAIGLIFQDLKTTLNDKVVDKSIDKIVHELNERFGAKLR